MRQLRAFPAEVSEALVARVKSAVHGAIARGLSHEHENLAHQFVASDGQLTVAVEE